MFRITSEICRQVFPVSLDLDNPGVRARARALAADHRGQARLPRKQGGVGGKLRNAGLTLAAAATFARLFLLPVEANAAARAGPPGAGLVDGRLSLLASGRYALFVWWFSTGVIILLDNLPRARSAGAWSAGTALFAGLAVAAARRGRRHLGRRRLCRVHLRRAGLGLAGDELLHGLRDRAAANGCRQDCRGWRHFGHGIEACLYHELAILATAAVIVAATWDAPNQVGTWTFMLLWAARTSAKLNVFLGVLNLGEQFLPPHLGFLRSFMQRKPMNLLLPLSVSAGTVATGLLIQRAMTPGIGEARLAGLACLITMLVLAVLEHWFLVLPLPFERLWSWVLQWRRPGLRHHRQSAMTSPRGASNELRSLLP